MALLERLAGISGEKLPVNQFHAALHELVYGEVTQQNIIDFFSLDAGEQTELQFIIDRYNAQATQAEKDEYVRIIRSLFCLAEWQVPGYTTNAELVARINRI